MNPNVDQLFSIARWLLSVGGPVSSLLIARGIPADKVSSLNTALLTVLGALPPIASFIWGLWAHTDNSKLKAVEAMPDVSKIIVNTAAPPNGAMAAAADPSRPKVTT